MTINTGQINAPSAAVSVGGVTLSEFRQRLRVQLSNYVAGTLIGLTNPDTERQFINDGIGQLWPYDFQTVMTAIAIVARRTRYYLPPDAEHVFEVNTADYDINEQTTVMVDAIPFRDGWEYQSSFIDASSPILADGTIWTDSVKKVLQINDLFLIGQTRDASQVTTPRYLVVRYARRWPSLSQEIDSIDPSPQRVQAIVHFAAASYFNSQLEVNTESMRLNNYIKNQQTEQGLALQNLAKDPKTLWMR